MSWDLVISGHLMCSQAGRPGKDGECCEVSGTQPQEVWLREAYPAKPWGKSRQVEDLNNRFEVQVRASSQESNIRTGAKD